MEILGNPVDGVEYGNAWEVDTRNNQGQRTGWLVGFSESLQGSRLRYMPHEAPAAAIGIKWFQHEVGDPGGVHKPLSTGRTISFLVNEGGRFVLRLWVG